jgi:YVTN family beta-propeller protein
MRARFTSSVQLKITSIRHLGWAACLFLAVSSAFGYALLGPFWPDGSTITMQLQLGSTNVKLQDGLGTWNNSAADALSLWNDQLATIQLAWVNNSTVPKLSGDGLSSVFFSNSVFGDDFGDDVLATTVYLTDEHNDIDEADVVVNQAFSFNSYRGPLQAGATDIHRVFLHEFGHVIGLAHPDGPSSNQMVVAIMNSAISNLDHLAPDDIDGASLLYGLKFVGDDPRYSRVGDPFSYKIATNIPATSYQASGLPPGLTINSKTGLITGAITISGTYFVDLTIDGPGNPNTQRLIISVVPNPPGDLRATLTLQAGRLLADPVRSRVYASLPESKSVAVINAANLSLIDTIPVKSAPDGMALSPDGTKLYVAEVGTTAPEIGVIDLDALSALPSLPAPAASIDVEAGLSNRLYVTTSLNPLETGVFQLDTSTGALLPAFPSGIPSGFIEISPDRTRLYLATADDSHSLYLFDSSLESPALLQTSSDRGQRFVDLKLSHDGSFFCVADPAIALIPEIPSTDLEGTVGAFSAAGSAWAPIAFSPDDQTFFKVGTDYFFSQIDTFDTTTTKFMRSLQGITLNPGDMVVDGSGQFLFVSNSTSPELEVLSTGAGIPTHLAKPESLLNVSTRLKSQTGENVLIGGFIISGTEPKQIVVRGVGPSLPLGEALADPVISLYDGDGKLVGTNDNWNSNRPGVLFTGLAPADEHEAVLVETLPPGGYTAIVSGADNGVGVALVEVYDLTPDSDSALANISTRGDVELGDNVMIGGFIIGADTPTKVMIRGIGPSLAQFGIVGTLQDPVLELHGGDGDLIFENDNWRSTQRAEIIATGIPPTDDRESAIVATLQPGAYTAIVRGRDNTTGVALVEVYNLDGAHAASK